MVVVLVAEVVAELRMKHDTGRCVSFVCPATTALPRTEILRHPRRPGPARNRAQNSAKHSAPSSSSLPIAQQRRQQRSQQNKQSTSHGEHLGVRSRHRRGRLPSICPPSRSPKKKHTQNKTNDGQCLVILPSSLRQNQEIPSPARVPHAMRCLAAVLFGALLHTYYIVASPHAAFGLLFLVSLVSLASLASVS